MSTELLTTNGWLGVCHVVGEVTGVQLPCKVTDVSSLGAGIELANWPYDAIVKGLRLAVEAPLPTGEAFPVRLVGEVRHVTKTASGFLVGIEFGDRSETEPGIISLFTESKLE